jgi:regulatory protein
MPRRAPRTLDSAELLDYAVKLLASRARSSGELRGKLRRRAAGDADVDAALARLKEFGYLDDRRFAESYAAARLDERRTGARRVLRDLRARRVPGDVAEPVVRQVFAGVDEDALIADFLRRKYPRPDPFPDEKSLASAYGKLVRAGFTPAAAARVLRSFARDPALLDGFDPAADEPAE